jgi:hypothetical protein
METITHQFKGFANLQHVYDSECLIHIEDRNPDEILICFEDIGKGTSVTNFSEQLATEIVALKGYDPEKCRFFEYYGKRPEEMDSNVITPIVQIEYKWDGREASEPDWKPIKPLESADLFWKSQGRIFKG